MRVSELLGTEERWIWLLAFSGVTGLIQLLTLPLLPESPRYLLLERADRHGCEMGQNNIMVYKTLKDDSSVLQILVLSIEPEIPCITAHLK